LPRRLARLAALILLTLAAPAAADEVRLKNGDRFSTGKVVALAGGTLVFGTPYGEVKIPWAEVDMLVVDEPIQVTSAAGQVTLHQGGALVIADVVALTRPQPAWIVDGGANAGLTATSGNTDADNLRLDGDVVARNGENRYTANAAVTRAEDDGAETARNWTTGLKYDRFVTPRLFFNANTILTNDRFRDLDLRTAIGAGIGYQVLNTARVTLTADAGLGYVNETLAGVPDDRYTALRESAALGVFLLPGRVQFFHQHDGYFGVTGDDNLFVKMQNGIRVGLTEGFVTTLRHDVDYDRSPAPGRRNTDRTLALTLGYRF
jgi:putative salt-induced outer membrane protein YdiY